MKDRQVACPACRGPSLYGPGNPWRPFCSQRCRTRDLGAWASEDYRVAAPPSADEADAVPPASPPDPARH
jgi:endogenous inhibitor of DNA gyrase (YacG/DUF329 family)